MRAKHIISEIATHPYPYEMGMDNVQFYDSSGNPYYVRFDDFSEGVWSVAFQASQFNSDALTDRHDAFRVFATLISIIKTWISSANPRALLFSANLNNPSRASLYAKLSKTFTANTKYSLLSDTHFINDFIIAHHIAQLVKSLPKSYRSFIIIRNDLIKEEIILDENWKEKIATVALATAVGAGGVGISSLKDKLLNKNQAATPDKSEIKAVVKQPTTFKNFIEKKKELDIQPLTNTAEEKILYKTALASGIKGHELAQLLAQCAHETMDFKHMVERGGKLDFKKYEPWFKINKKTKKVVNVNPKADILGNTKKGDGEKFKGRGFIQLTGRDNYARAGKDLGIDLVNNPELAAKPEIAAKIALWYWNKRVKTKVDDFTDTHSVTRQINPALRGIKDRLENYAEYINPSD